jgi:protein tyrosine phosphatase
LFASQQAVFRKLNRYRDILPYKHNRVVLNEFQTFSHSNEDAEERRIESTYINASYISSAYNKRAFVAT